MLGNTTEGDACDTILDQTAEALSVIVLSEQSSTVFSSVLNFFSSRKRYAGG